MLHTRGTSLIFEETRGIGQVECLKQKQENSLTVPYCIPHRGDIIVFVLGVGRHVVKFPTKLPVTVFVQPRTRLLSSAKGRTL